MLSLSILLLLSVPPAYQAQTILHCIAMAVLVGWRFVPAPFLFVFSCSLFAYSFSPSPPPSSMIVDRLRKYRIPTL